MLGQWASTRAIHHALTADKEMPPASKKEAEGDTDWSKMAKYRRWREEHDHEFSQALMSPKHFGSWLGMPSVLGEPPPETVKSLEEVQREQQEHDAGATDRAKLYLVNDSILAKAAKEGRGFSADSGGDFVQD